MPWLTLSARSRTATLVLLATSTTARPRSPPPLPKVCCYLSVALVAEESPCRAPCTFHVHASRGFPSALNSVSLYLYRSLCLLCVCVCLYSCVCVCLWLCLCCLSVPDCVSLSVSVSCLYLAQLLLRLLPLVCFVRKKERKSICHYSIRAAAEQNRRREQEPCHLDQRPLRPRITIPSFLNNCCCCSVELVCLHVR